MIGIDRYVYVFTSHFYPDAPQLEVRRQAFALG